MAPRSPSPERSQLLSTTRRACDPPKPQASQREVCSIKICLCAGVHTCHRVSASFLALRSPARYARCNHCTMPGNLLRLCDYFKTKMEAKKHRKIKTASCPEVGRKVGRLNKAEWLRPGGGAEWKGSRSERLDRNQTTQGIRGQGSEPREAPGGARHGNSTTGRAFSKALSGNILNPVSGKEERCPSKSC